MNPPPPMAMIMSGFVFCLISCAVFPIKVWMSWYVARM